MSGRECCENPPALSSSSGNGCVLKVGSFNAYVSGPSTSKLAILLVSDVYGYEAPNLRNIVDKVAAAGYYVVVPDFFCGDPYTIEKTLSIWIQSHGTAKGFEDAKQIIAVLKDKGISAIGAAGFCWGAKVVTELAKSDYIQAAVLLHPSLVKVDDFKEVKAPIAILAAEIDKISPPELIIQFEEVLSSKPEVDKFVKIFPGVKHGWTVRYNVENKEAVQHAEEAHRDMLDWLTKYVKYSQKGSGLCNVRGPHSSM
ncbi:endo-1,3;1,4-beta-D-glucanase-like isoform X1 [Solanum lycopersicum]|uniref:Dienelactone hydrolase domain-containing protein n=2 Tax=Solanum lycopersicum TaxID=4081 RepID=A0A3Q7IE75_SOLLC|nr:endo-1,3;1,4-beta-D-glucanase-like isoform X1 [Solanum lycopersicum]